MNRPICMIAPPDLLISVAREGDPEDRDAAVKALTAAASARAQRIVTANLMREFGVRLDALSFTTATAGRHNTVYDAQNQIARPGVKARGDGDPESSDESVNHAYDGAEITHQFYKDVYGRDSLDDNGVELVSSVHYRRDLDNAFWTGEQMLYGDGSGRIFKKGSLVAALDVCGHELTHGVVGFSANLAYHNQSGALNESFADVFGSLVKQKHNGQTAEDADWLLGAGILGPALAGDALRSLKDPGTANERDRQPKGMDSFVDLPDTEEGDYGGVHINSGIPNHAFYLAATALGGNAWEVAGQIWYTTLTEQLRANSDFKETAQATVEVAESSFGSDERDAVENAWKEVGVL
jgi:Zn-dependent metalloprotease